MNKKTESFIYKNKSYGPKSIKKIFGCNNQTASYLIKRINEKQLDPSVIFDYKDIRRPRIFLRLKTGEIISARRLRKLIGVSYLAAKTRMSRAPANIEIDILLDKPRPGRSKKKHCLRGEDSEILYQPPSSPEQEKLLKDLSLTPRELEIQNRYYPSK